MCSYYNLTMIIRVILLFCVFVTLVSSGSLPRNAPCKEHYQCGEGLYCSVNVSWDLTKLFRKICEPQHGYGTQCLRSAKCRSNNCDWGVCKKSLGVITESPEPVTEIPFNIYPEIPPEEKTTRFTEPLMELKTTTTSTTTEYNNSTVGNSTADYNETTSTGTPK